MKQFFTIKRKEGKKLILLNGEDHMYFSLPTGLKLIIDNETSNTLNNVKFYANGTSITGTVIKNIKSLDRKTTAIIPQSLKLNTSTYTLTMSVDDSQEDLLIQSDVETNYFGNYLIKIKEETNGTIYALCSVEDNL